MSLYQLRGSDIPWAVGRGWVDCGLCGLDAVVETKAEVSVLHRFPETTTRISLIERPGAEARRSGDVFSVVTEYPEITKSRLQPRYRDLRIWQAHGACETFAFMDEVDGVVDIVDTGETLRRNGLIVREVLFETCICLIARSGLQCDDGGALLAGIRRCVSTLSTPSDRKAEG